MTRWVERAWRSDGGLVTALSPLSWLFGGAVALRNRLYDISLLRSHDLGLPSVSIGNLTVGGTGKTPVSAWVAGRLLKQNVKPAILLRGYGDDEPEVHRRLNPGAVVVANPDRVAGAAAARGEGAQVLVLDDAFQHRRARRDIDIVLVAAEHVGKRRMLPAGPFRELPRALGRAHHLVVTRKEASPAQAEGVLADLLRWLPGRSGSVLYLRPGRLVPVSSGPDLPAGGTDPSPSLIGARVLAVSAIGNPQSFEEQLRGLGAHVESRAFADHHGYSDAEIRQLAAESEAQGRIAVCTLKDAVKLGGRWPRNGPRLWYLSQDTIVERGEQALTDLIDSLVTSFSRQQVNL